MTTPLSRFGDTRGWMNPPSGRGIGKFDETRSWIPGASNTDEQLKRLDAQAKRIQGQIDRLNKAISALKKPSDKKAMPQYDRQMKQLQEELKAQQKLMTSVTSQRTKIYTSTGQYEKLLSGESRDAYLAINSLFKSYGLESLAGKIFEYVKNGYSGDTISILLQDTPEYKKRFAGNEARTKAGLPVLSPAEYLSTEASYRQIMQSAGLPSGFYDQPSDFNTWIGMNVSPSEIQTRVDMASQATTLANPNYRKALNQMGISDSQLTAYFLDPTRALPALQKSAATAAIGAEALSQGLAFDKTYAEQLALEGVSGEQAKQGYAQVASELSTYQNLGAIYGDQWTQRMSEQAAFEGTASAVQKKARLASQERGAFGGATGGSRAGLGQAGGAR